MVGSCFEAVRRWSPTVAHPRPICVDRLHPCARPTRDRAHGRPSRAAAGNATRAARRFRSGGDFRACGSSSRQAALGRVPPSGPGLDRARAALGTSLSTAGAYSRCCSPAVRPYPTPRHVAGSGVCRAPERGRRAHPCGCGLRGRPDGWVDPRPPRHSSRSRPSGTGRRRRLPVARANLRTQRPGTCAAAEHPPNDMREIGRVGGDA